MSDQPQRSASDPKPAPVTGRTPWDAAVESVKLLGVPLLVVGAGVFAVYEFQQQAMDQQQAIEAARREVAESYQEQLAQANTSLIATSKAIGDMNSAMLGDVKRAFDTLSEAQQRIAELQTTQLDAQRREQEALLAIEQFERDRAAAEMAMQAAQRATEAARDARSRAEQARASAEEQRRLAEQRLRNLRDERDRVLAEIAEMQRIRSEESRRLADAVLSGDAPASDEAVAIATKLRGDYLDPASAVESYTKNPTSASLVGLFGLTQDEFRQVVSKDPRGFAWWGWREDAGGPAFVGVLGEDADGLRGFVELSVSDDGRILTPSQRERYIALPLPDLEDWDVRIAYYCGFDPDVGYDTQNPLVTTLPLDEVEVDAAGRWLVEGGAAATVSGTAPAVRPLTLAELRQRYPDIHEYIMATHLGEDAWAYEVVDEMLANAQDFDGAQRIRAATRGQDDLDAALVAALAACLDAAVKRDAEDRQRLAAPGFDAWGRLAAVALQPEFEVLDAKRGERSDRRALVHLVHGRDLDPRRTELSFTMDGPRDGWRLQSMREVSVVDMAQQAMPAQRTPADFGGARIRDDLDLLRDMIGAEERALPRAQPPGRRR